MLFCQNWLIIIIIIIIILIYFLELGFSQYKKMTESLFVRKILVIPKMGKMSHFFKNQGFSAFLEVSSLGFLETVCKVLKSG